MELIETNYDEYKKMFSPIACYNQAEFNDMNSARAKEIHYFIFKDTKIRFGLIIGEKDDGWYCPFSAPFGTFVSVKKKWNLFQLEEAIKCFDDYMKSKGTVVTFVMPPEFYDSKMVCTMQNTLFNLGYLVKDFDINFQLDIRKLYGDDYINLLQYNGRKNLNIALASELEIKHCNTENEKVRAYNIIKVNREMRGYPLNMSCEQVMKTIDLVKHDMFIVKHNQDEIAAALIYCVEPRIAQVIYWGDVPGCTEYKPINFLAYQLINYYGEREYDYLDIGISTDHSIINYGLSDFKISIGCDTAMKLTLKKDYSEKENEKVVGSEEAALGTLEHNEKYFERIGRK